jgi:hypothetical protein
VQSLNVLVTNATIRATSCTSTHAYFLSRGNGSLKHESFLMRMNGSLNSCITAPLLRMKVNGIAVQQKNEFVP